MNKRCIVNVATGEYYCKMQSRLTRSFSNSVVRYHNGQDLKPLQLPNDSDIDLMVWRDYLPAGSHSHADSPYGFKIHAIKAAYEKGYTSILWIDSPAYAVKEDVSPIFDKIEHEGYYVMSHIDPLENWIGERVLNKLKVSRESLKGFNLPSGTCYGFDLNNHSIFMLFERFALMEANGYFEREHLYFGGEIIGWHRHDEAILALLLMEAKLPVFTFDPLFQSDSPECVIRSGEWKP